MAADPVPPDSGPTAGPLPAGRLAVPWPGRRAAVPLALAAGLAVAGTSTVLATDANDQGELLAAAGAHLAGAGVDDLAAAAGGALAAAGGYLGGLRWPFLLPVVLLAGAHYAGAAVGVRAAAGVPTRFGTTVLVQLAAAAANRLTFAGVGGTAVNTRYLTRLGLGLPAALSSVTALGVLSLAARALALLVLVLAAAAAGPGGGHGQLSRLGHHLLGPLGPPRPGWAWAAAGLAAALLALWVRRRARGGSAHRRAELRRRLWAPARELLDQPRRLVPLLVAAAATPLLLGTALIACVRVVPGAHPTASTAGLLVAYMLGGAVGGASPLPGGVGATEAALTATLVADGLTAGQALQAVLIFRVVTFWLPALAGLGVSRHLVRTRVL